MSASVVRGALGAAALLACGQAVFAHAVLERREATPDAPYRGVIQIMHGCKGSPTTSVSVTIPEGAIGARPMAKSGWTIATEKGAYARSYPGPHGALSEGVKRISWTGGSLPADQFDEFVFSVRLSDEFRPEDTVYFPVEQTCAAGRHAWTEIPGPGREARTLEAPAPGVRIVAAAAQTSEGAGGAAIKVGDLTIEQPWLRATPQGAKVAGGYLRVTNRGSSPDRLVGTSIPLAGRGEVHEMSNEGGVMKMREVAGGLAIPPGQTVELKPGGYHLMFMDLRGGVKTGDTVRGTLTFERAGTVEVTFRVAPVGAPGPAGSRHHHH